MKTSEGNRPIGILTRTPLGGPPGRLVTLQIRKESIPVAVYKWTCDKCGRRLQHRDRRTLEHNAEEHLAARHGEQAERRHNLEDVKKKLFRLAADLNRR